MLINSFLWGVISTFHETTQAGVMDETTVMTEREDSSPKEAQKSKRPRLTPQQLERKRKSDRDNQRAVRARTKNRIKELESLVDQLKGQLQDSESKWQALKDETQHLYDAANVFMKCDAVTRVRAENTRSARTPDQHATTQSEEGMDSSDDVHLASLRSTRGSACPSNIARKNHTNPRTTSPVDGSNVNDSDLEFFGLTTNFEPTTSHHNSADSPVSDQDVGDMTIVSSAIPFQDDSIFQFDFAECQYPLGETAGFLNPSFHFTLPVQQPPIWTLLPDLSAPTVPMDQGLKDIFHKGAQLHPTVLKTELSSSIGTAITETLTPKGSNARFPICALVAKWMISNFGSQFSGNFVDFVGVLYIIYSMIRWRVVPTKETYGSIPEWMRPNLEQLQTAHPAWMDCFPWPKARSQIVKSFKVSRFDLFSEICSTTVSMNWPLGVESVLIWSDVQSKTILNPSYETHIMTLENWTLGTSLIDMLPSLDGLVKCRLTPMKYRAWTKSYYQQLNI